MDRPDSGNVAANVAAIRARIARAAERVGRDPASVRLIAVSKTKPAAMVEAALAAGLTDIGENYVQEAVAKHAAVTGVGRWHMIGHLQRNKVARALEIFDCVQTVDSPALGEAISRRAAEIGRTISLLVEVNIGGEATKHGVAPAALAALLNTLRPLPHVRVEGLMTIPPASGPDESRGFFRRLRALRDEHGVAELSMGMTDDFEIAVEEGATMVRVGRAIFGQRTGGGRR